MPTILCLNAGSSSLKYALFAVEHDGERRLAEGAVERIGQPKSRVRWRGSQGDQSEEIAPVADHAAATRVVLTRLERAATPAAIGHRIVHGGPDYYEPVRLDARVVEHLRALVPFAPLHLPGALAVVEAVRAHAPELPQVGCFDTAFHRALPEEAQRFALPEETWRAGVRRYGFHGLSYEYVLEALGEEAHGRVIIAHLGHGASLAAVRAGAPQDTTMGLTPAGGVVMGTRSGDLDPGVLVFLSRAKGWDADRLDRLVNQESGLLGVSGTTSDMETLLAVRGSDPRAALAVDLFCRSVRKQIGALAAVLGGLDTLVFTGGIGEHAAPVRAEICRGLEFLGVQLDPARNERHADVLCPDGAPCRVRRIATDEDRMIARKTSRLLSPVDP